MPAPLLVGRPEPTEFDSYFAGYISLVEGDDPMPQLAAQPGELHEVLDGVSADESLIHHAPYTWSLRQVLGHCIDTERVFGYRICRIAANDTTPLPGFDQDAFIANVDFDQVSLPDLIDEFEWMRRSHLRMLKRIPAENWTRSGTASGGPLSVRAGAFILAGHLRHHLNIIRKRLGV